MKKIISALLAGFMAVSALTSVAFADLKPDSSISLKSTTIIPVLKVTLPKTLAFVVNPYKMEIDVTTGKAPTATSESSNIVKTQVVPTYGTTVSKDPSTGATTVTPNTAWQVLNESGIAISCMLYATAVNGNPTAPFEILDVNNSNKNAITGAAADVKTRQLSLALMAKSGSGSAVPVKFSSTAPTAWTTVGGCTSIASIANNGTLDLTLDTSKSICAVGKSCEETLWTAKDIATINIFFKFDFVAA